MTTKVEARDAIVSHLEDGWLHKVQVPLHYENRRTISLENVKGDHLMYVVVRFMDGQQVSIGPKPRMRTYGRIEFHLFSREGSGVRDELVYQDAIEELFKFKSLGGVTTEAPMTGRIEEHDGWRSATFQVPFFADIQ